MGAARGGRRPAPDEHLSPTGGRRLAARAARPLVPVLARLVRRWIARQRRVHRARARPLTDDRRAALEPFFGEALAAVRVAVVPEIRPPRWLAPFARLGRDAFADFERVRGITLGDTILLRERVPDPERGSLLFHELVHVEQARQLGPAGFARAYVSGWVAAGFRYAEIPLERDARALQRRWSAAPGRRFDVAAEVGRRLAQYG